MQHAPPGEGKAPPGQLPWVDSRPQDVKSRDSEHSCHQAALLEHLEPLACRPGRGGHGHLSDGLAEMRGSIRQHHGQHQEPGELAVARTTAASAIRQGAGSSPGGAGYGDGLRHLSQVWRCWVASFLADDHWEGQSPIKGP